jgi:hypothetical protein
MAGGGRSGRVRIAAKAAQLCSFEKGHHDFRKRGRLPDGAQDHGRPNEQARCRNGEFATASRLISVFRPGVTVPKPETALNRTPI